MYTGRLDGLREIIFLWPAFHQLQWPRLSAEDRQRAKPEGRTRFDSRLRANFTCWADKEAGFPQAAEGVLYCDLSFDIDGPYLGM